LKSQPAYQNRGFLAVLIWGYRSRIAIWRAHPTKIKRKMPELPEVETIMRGIAPVLTGRRIESVEARRPDLRWPLPPRFVERLEGATVLGLRRRSKYILSELDTGETWLAHLGMSGRFSIKARTDAQFPKQIGDFAHAHPGSRDGKHDHIIVETRKNRLIYTDARRFGAMDLCLTDALDKHKWLSNLGPEPFGNGFNAMYLFQRIKGRKAPIKTLLLDQKVVAGLGNIYVCEALWRAGINPRLAGGDMRDDRISALIREIRKVLAEAINAGGSSLRDHRQATGEHGYFQHAFKVYGRFGKKCRRPGCAGLIDKTTQSGRSTFFCPNCQT
jgi:formamidopyrimidine-DNA glycosylase